MRKLIYIKVYLLLFFMSISSPASTVDKDWKSISELNRRQTAVQYKINKSYVISGSLGILGGFLGQSLSSDPMEQAVYTVFQSVGVAAIGHGLSGIYLNDDIKTFYQVLIDSDLSDEKKYQLFINYQKLKEQDLEPQKRIKALTHGMIAVLNIYNASRQKNGVVKDGLFFIGGINVLAALSFTFDF